MRSYREKIAITCLVGTLGIISISAMIFYKRKKRSFDTVRRNDNRIKEKRPKSEYYIDENEVDNYTSEKLRWFWVGRNLMSTTILIFSTWF